MKLNKNDLVKAIAASSGQTQVEAREALEVVFGAICDELSKGNAINIPGFGMLEVIKRKSRSCVNPITKEPMMSAPKRAVRLKVSSTLKVALNAG